MEGGTSMQPVSYPAGPPQMTGETGTGPSLASAEHNPGQHSAPNGPGFGPGSMAPSGVAPQTNPQMAHYYQVQA